VSDSYKYDPDNPGRAYSGKVNHNNTRRTRQKFNKERSSRQQEFNTGINSSHPDDSLDAYGDFDYSRSKYARYTTAA
jgi:hypothetical protein